MFASFIKFTLGFIAILLIGIGFMALSSYATPFFAGAKAAILDAFR